MSTLFAAWLCSGLESSGGSGSFGRVQYVEFVRSIDPREVKLTPEPGTRRHDQTCGECPSAVDVQGFLVEIGIRRGTGRALAYLRGRTACSRAGDERPLEGAGVA